VKAPLVSSDLATLISPKDHVNEISESESSPLKYMSEILKSRNSFSKGHGVTIISQPCPRITNE
jgi:hypothetical protein